MDLSEQLHHAQERIASLAAENARLQQTMHGYPSMEACKQYRAQAALFETFLTHAPAAVALFDTQMRYLAASNRWIRDYSLEGKPLIGRSHYEVFPDIPERWKRVHQQVLAGNTERCAEDTYERADGTKLWISWEITPWREDNGDIGGLMMFTEVVTEQMKAREVMAHQWSYLRQVLDTMPNLVTITDNEGRYQLVNRHAAEFFHMPVEEILGKTWHELPPVQQGWLQHDGKVIMAQSQDVLITEEHYFNIHAAEVFWFQILQVPFITHDGTYRLLVATDVTARKVAEEALRHSESRYRNLVENINDMVWEIDERLHFTYVSPRVHNILGYTEHEVLGVSPIEMIPDAEAQRVAAFLQPYAERGEPFPTVEHPMLCKDGRRIIVEVNGAPLFDNSGEFRGFRGVMRDVTARRHIQSALLESERRFRTLLEEMQMMALIIDPSNQIRFANDYLLHTADYTREELLGQDWVELFAVPEERAQIRGLLRTRFQGIGRQSHGAMTILLRNGEQRRIYWHATLLHDADGKISGLAAIGEDVTDRLRAEAALRANEARLSEAQRLAHLGNFEFAMPDACLSWSEETYRILGIPQSGRAPHLQEFLQYVHRADRDAVDHAIQQTFTTATPFDLTYRVVRPDGMERIVESIGQPVLRQNGPVERVFGTLHDITDHIRIEEALQESEERYRSIVETAGEGIWLIDNHGFTRYVNQQMADMLGYTRDAMRGRLASEFFTDGEEQAFKDALASPCEALPLHAELHMRRHDGRDVWAIVAISPVRDAYGACVGLAGMFTDITDRHQAEVALRESEEKFRQLAESSEAVVGIIQGRRFIYINPYMEKLSGYTREELLLFDIDHFLAPESRDLVLQRARERQMGQPNLPSHYEFVMITKWGEKRWIELSVSTYLYQGRPAIVGTGFDITDRQRAEAALRESEEKFRALAEHASAAVTIIQHERFLYMNPCIESLTEYTREELLRMPLNSVITPEYHDIIVERAQRRLRGEDVPMCYEIQFRAKSGGLRWAEVSAAAMELCGEPAIIAIMNDVTDRKQAQDALERERAFLSSAIDVLPFPIFFLDPTHKVIRSNAAHRDLAPLLPAQWQDLSLLTPDTRILIPFQKWPTNRALHGQTIQGFEGIMRADDDVEMPVIIHSAPICAGGEQVAAVVAVQDITILKEADRAKDDFLAVLSHELLTPLTSIIGWAQATREKPDILHQALEIIERNARRQHYILNDLLDMSRIIHGKLHMALQTSDVWTLMLQVIEDLQQSFTTADLHLVIVPPAEPLPIYVDPDRMRQVLINLLNNAMKYSDKGGSITVTARRDGEHAVLTVSDDGRGIPQEKLDVLFRPFQQVHRDEAKGGLGLGLALVRGLVELHHGQVTAESPGIGQGSTFTVTLPLAVPMAKAA